MIKKMNKKGFTLAELLIVVAIIGVLVAISIPVFTQQLQKSRLAANQANARAAYAAALTRGIIEDTTLAAPKYKYTVVNSNLELVDSTSGTEVAGVPQNWTINSSNLGNVVAKVWYVSFENYDGTPTYRYES